MKSSNRTARSSGPGSSNQDDSALRADLQSSGPPGPQALIGSVTLFDASNNLVGTFTTIQAAVDAASAGYTVIVANGTYAETVTVDVDVTIRGANDGNPGTAAVRDPESILDGAFIVTANGVTIDGFEIIGADGTSGFDTGVYVAGDNFSLVNTIFDGPDTAFGMLTEEVLGLNVGDNKFAGYGTGIYVSGDTTGSIHDNLFQGDGGPSTGLGNGVNSESTLALIEDNNFDGIYAGSLNLFPGGPDSVDLLDYVIGNTITNSGAERPIQIVPTNETHNVLGTDENEAFDGETAALNGVTGAFTFDGRGGNDHVWGGGAGDTFDGGTGLDEFTGNGGDDSLNGDGGLDAAIYTGNVEDYTIVYEFDLGGNVIGFLEVTDNNAVGGDEGHDTLSSIEKLIFANAVIDPANDRVQLFNVSNNLVGTFNDIQAAIDAASDGYRIEAEAGTYAEDLIIDVDVTINGANAGIAGTGARGAETSIDGQVTVSAAGVTIDGVAITGDGPGTLGTTGVVVGSGANDFSLVNSVLDGSGNFAIFVGAVTGLDVGNNLIEGYEIGMYIATGGTTGSVHDNRFQGDGGPLTGLGNGVNSETTHVLIANNIFDGIYNGSLNLFPFGPDSIDLNTYIIGNTITNSGAARPVQILPTNLTHNIAGTDYNEAFDGETAALAGVTGAFSYDGRGGDDRAWGGEEGDSLAGGSGSDMLFGNGGNDVLNGGTGADAMFGGAGNDTYFIDDGGDSVTEAAGEGADIAYTTGSYALAAGSEVEILSALDNGGAGAMDLYGNEFGNQLWGNNGVNFLAGGGGADVLIGFGGGDLLVGGAAGDYLDGGGDGDAMYGSEGDDTLIGGAGADYMDGGTGADGIYGGTGDDVYFVDSASDFASEAAGEGYDVVYTTVSYALTPGSEVELLSALDNGSLGAMDLTGNDFANEIYGTNGANFLTGAGGDDVLIGFAGNDLLIGGGGNDYMDGGAGADTFAFVAPLGAGNIDTIVNYSGAGTDGEDIIALDDAVFAGLGLGPLDPNAFVIGTAAGDADDRIIYDSITGALYFDADGSGAGAAVQFATLLDAPPLTAGDFIVI